MASNWAATFTRPSLMPLRKAWTPNVALSAFAAAVVSSAVRPETLVSKPARVTLGVPVRLRTVTRALPTRAERRIRLPTLTL